MKVRELLRVLHGSFLVSEIIRLFIFFSKFIYSYFQHFIAANFVPLIHITKALIQVSILSLSLLKVVFSLLLVRFYVHITPYSCFY